MFCIVDICKYTYAKYDLFDKPFSYTMYDDWTWWIIWKNLKSVYKLIVYLSYTEGLWCTVPDPEC